jgi:hypothetical protein
MEFEKDDFRFPARSCHALRAGIGTEMAAQQSGVTAGLYAKPAARRRPNLKSERPDETAMSQKQPGPSVFSPVKVELRIRAGAKIFPAIPAFAGSARDEFATTRLCAELWNTVLRSHKKPPYESECESEDALKMSGRKRRAIVGLRQQVKKEPSALETASRTGFVVTSLTMIGASAIAPPC